jgi:tetratricopeptide (TPR) repeat protein
LWNQLGYGQAGLKQYDDAITAYKKSVDLETASKKPRGPVIGQAQAGLGEIYARQGKVPEANAAFDAAAKADPATGPLYLKNQAIIFYQENNPAGMSAAADEAIKAAPKPDDPSLALLYYIKGQGLLQQFAAADPKNPAKIVLTPETIAAYQEYLQLAPKGQFAGDVAGILQQAGVKPK